MSNEYVPSNRCTDIMCRPIIIQGDDKPAASSRWTLEF